MSPLMKPPTIDPAMPSPVVNQNPIATAPGKNLAKPPTMNPTTIVLMIPMMPMTPPDGWRPACVDL
jgi:hypothetical protein